MSDNEFFSEHNMKTSGQNHLKVFIVTFLMCIIQANGAVLSITTNPEQSRTTRDASLTCSISPFTLGAEWIKNKSSLTQCLSGLCIPPFSTRYQYSANATSITVTIPSPDVAQDETTWTCAYNLGADVATYNLTVYSTPSANLSITGPTSSAVNDNVTVHLSVSTGCIHPSDPEYYNVMWKYVEAGFTAEKLFETGITQTVTSVGGCANAYENSLMLNLYLTNKMNTRTTTLSITQVKMIFTMAGVSSPASLNVAYNVTGTGKTYTSSSTSDSKTKEIVGGTLGGVGGVGAVGAGVAVGIYLYKRKKSNGKKADGEDSEAQNDGKKDTKSKTGESEPKVPPASHIRTQNRVESEPTIKKTSDRPQPSPPVTVVSEDIPKHRPQPPPPENSDVNDPNKRGLSANFDDKQGLPTGTPGTIRLPPLPQKQAPVEEEDALKEKTKKKRNNKKKKGQKNEGNPEEEMVELTSKRTLPEMPEDQSDGN